MLQEFYYIVMIEQDLRVAVELLYALVLHHHRCEVDQLHRRLLFSINLSMLDSDQVVADVFLNLEGDRLLQQDLDHLVVFRLNELVYIITRNVEVVILGDGSFQFVIV